MAITLSCECGKKLAVKEEMAGKKVKCPGCGAVLTVPSGAVENSVETEDERDDDSAGGAPAKKKSRSNGSGAPAKKSKMLLWIGVAAGVLVLGSCCCGGIGIGGWLLLRGGPEKTIIGKWGLDIDKTKQNNMIFQGMPPQMEKEMAKMVIEIKADGTLTRTDSKKTETSKWKNAEAKDNMVTIEAQKPGANEPWEKLTFKVLDNNSLQFTPPGTTQGSVWLKRL
jgi:hypothetical protein